MNIERLYFLWTLIVASIICAVFSYLIPLSGMPVDYDAALYRSLPLSAFWLITAAASLYLGKRKGLWALFGLVPALYWPAQLLLNGIPECYRIGNCA